MTISLKIDRNIPFPNNGAVAAWAQMEVGDSVFVKTRSATIAAHQWGARHRIKFAARSWTQNGTEGFRIWRLR